MQETSNREWLDERNYRILHNRYDEKGNVVEQFYRYYTENEDKGAVYFHPDLFMKMQDEMSTGAHQMNFAKEGKKVLLECEELGFMDKCPEIKGLIGMWHETGHVVCRCISIETGEPIIIESTDNGKTLRLFEGTTHPLIEKDPNTSHFGL